MLEPDSFLRHFRRSRSASTRRLVRGLALVLLIVPLAAFDSIEALFAPSADLWPRWQAHDPASDKAIDHGTWNSLIADHSQLDPQGIRQVDYAALAGPARPALDSYLTKLAALPISSYNRDEQFAYWANLYNALTAQVVADHWPVESIRDIDISPGWFSDGPWDAELIEVEGEKLSLNDVEHRILRPIWGDPRVHYAVNCAAVGCPNLAAQAFNGAELNRQLEVAARAFVNDPRGNCLRRRWRDPLQHLYMVPRGFWR